MITNYAPATEVDRSVVITRQAPPSRELKVALTMDGELFLGGDRTDLASLRKTARAAVAADAGVRVILAADRRAPYGRVAELMSALKAEGVSRFAFAIEAGTSPP